MSISLIIDHDKLILFVFYSTRESIKTKLLQK